MSAHENKEYDTGKFCKGIAHSSRSLVMCVMSKAAYSLPYPMEAGQGVGVMQFTLILHRHSYSVGA